MYKRYPDFWFSILGQKGASYTRVDTVTDLDCSSDALFSRCRLVSSTTSCIRCGRRGRTSCTRTARRFSTRSRTTETGTSRWSLCRPPHPRPTGTRIQPRRAAVVAAAGAQGPRGRTHPRTTPTSSSSISHWMRTVRRMRRRRKCSPRRRRTIGRFWNRRRRRHRRRRRRRRCTQRHLALRKPRWQRARGLEADRPSSSSDATRRRTSPRRWSPLPETRRHDP